MDSLTTPIGVRPPQQARSRKALEKVLASSEAVLAEVGYDDFTMAAVAAHAGVSIGAIYRRFEGKEHLLGAVKDRLLSRFETDLHDRLTEPTSSLDDVVAVFVHTVAEVMETGQGFFPDLLLASRGSGELADRGRRAMARSQESFELAAMPHGDEVVRSDVAWALRMVSRTVTGACIHRALVAAANPEVPQIDGLGWGEYADGLTDMAVAFLRTADRSPSS